MDDPIQRHPTRNEQLDLLVSMIAEQTNEGDWVLDIGCGTGYVGHLLQARRPSLNFVGVDLSAAALGEAAANLTGYLNPPTLVEGDLMQPRSIDVPGGPYRAIWTALTFHDLTEPAKQEVIGWLAGLLASDGYLFIYDRVRLENASTFPLQQSIWHRIERQYGVAMRGADSFDEYRADLDRTNTPASLSDYFRWLPAAGLDAQLLHLHGNVMLMGGALQST